MANILKKTLIAGAAALTLAGSMAAAPSVANARGFGGGGHFGGGHVGGFAGRGFARRGFGPGFGVGVGLGALAVAGAYGTCGYGYYAGPYGTCGAYGYY